MDEYLRCIDCKFFGEHGAYCSLLDREAICITSACVFFQWKVQNKYQKMDPIYFFPKNKEDQVEMNLRGMTYDGYTCGRRENNV